jgi:hypothetical protein
MGPIVQTMWMVIIAAAQLGTLAQLAKQVFMINDFQTFIFIACTCEIVSFIYLGIELMSFIHKIVIRNELSGISSGITLR